MRARRRAAVGAAALAVLAGCSDFDLDLRGPGLDTSEAALAATADRPQPDDRGVISYPGYQVAVARRGDTVADVAARVGLPAGELARFNGAPAGAALNAGEVLALPRRVAEPSPATGAPATGPIRPSSEVDVTELAGAAIARADSAETIRREGPVGPSQTGAEPIRHKVRSGETAYTIARRYNVPVSALAAWNGLDDDYTLRQGQFLLIPPQARSATERAPEASEPPSPGTGSPTPTPPSAAEPLPEDTPPAANPSTTGADNAGAGGTGSDAATAGAGAPPAAPESPDLAAERTEASGSGGRFLVPVPGPIIRDFAPGRNEGIDIAAEAGTEVRAAAAGTVAAITRDTEGVPILVLRHEGGLLTVYANVDDLAVEKGDTVTRGQTVARVRAAESPMLHFEVREGVEAVDPNDFIQ